MDKKIKEGICIRCSKKARKGKHTCKKHGYQKSPEKRWKKQEVKQ